MLSIGSNTSHKICVQSNRIFFSKKAIALSTTLYQLLLTFMNFKVQTVREKQKNFRALIVTTRSCPGDKNLFFLIYKLNSILIYQKLSFLSKTNISNIWYIFNMVCTASKQLSFRSNIENVYFIEYSLAFFSIYACLNIMTK